MPGCKGEGSESVSILQNICEIVLEFPSAALHIRLPFSPCGKKKKKKRVKENTRKRSAGKVMGQIAAVALQSGGALVV